MRMLTLTVAALSLTLSAHADLSVGAPAPEFTAPASLDGKPFTFTLSEALQKGPVVVYFYPKAFTKGCTLEANAFAEAMPDFEALHATVIGISADDIDTLNKFSKEECRSKFAVASDADQAIMKAYDAVLEQKPELSDRTSYVISPEGIVIYAYTNLDYEQHVGNTLAAVKEWQAEQPTAP